MAHVLSQEEIDALLGGLSHGRINTNPEHAALAKARIVSLFDFADQDRATRTRLPALETIHDNFARQLRLSLSALLQRTVDIQISNQMVCEFGDFSRSLQNPSSLHLINFEPLKGQGLIVLPGPLILTLIDLLFGGSGNQIDGSNHGGFTMIEGRVIQKVAAHVCRCWGEAWTPVFPLDVTLTGAETDVRLINIAKTTDPVHVLDCDVIIEKNRTSFSLCMPYAALEPIKAMLRGHCMGENGEQDKTSSHQLRAGMLEAGVEVRAMLGTATITGRDLLQLHSGDILQLNEDYEHPVEILVEGIRKFWGIIGAHKSARALQITGFEETKRNHA